MENPKHHFLTFKSLIISVICLNPVDLVFSQNTSFNRSENELSLSALVVINEIMADPTPLVGLPDAEWIELFNAGKEPVRLKNWKLLVGTTVKALPDSVIPAGQFILVCSAKTAPELQKSGRTLVLSTLPSLRNSGNLLTLTNATDSLVDRIDYSDSWYRDTYKKNGGWSLERIDPERFCGQPANWGASVNPSGGTPGATNSILAINKDITSPQIISSTAVSSRMTEITFSEAMDTISLKNRKNYSLSGGYGFPDSAIVTDGQTIRLKWGRSFQPNTTYIVALGDLYDPCGNKLTEQETEVGWIVLQKGDVVINEILFNPWPGGADFVEIFNRSAKKIPLQKLKLATKDAEGQLKSLSGLGGSQTVLLPGACMAFTEDTTGISAFYRTPCRNCIRRVSSLPAFNNDKGTVVLLTDSLLVLDEFDYSEDMHHPLLYDPEGVTLERINPEVSASEYTNWQSASSASGFATPGYQNSQYLAEPVKRSMVSFLQTSISPNNDGYNDELTITYETKTSGWTGNCRIFDLSGREILQLFKNMTLSTSGVIRWDGKDASGGKLSLGPYLVLIEMFDLSGHVDHFRKAVILTEKGER